MAEARLVRARECAYIAAMTAHSRLKPFAAVVFDMDGTLLDTEAAFRDIVFTVSSDLGYEMHDHVHLSMVGSSHERTRAILVEAYGAAFPTEMFEEKCRLLMRERMQVTVPLKAGVVELLTELRARGIPAAVATSSRALHARSHLKIAGILDRFHAVVTRDDVQNPKPHPEPYLMAARLLGVEPGRCLAVEDSHSGVRAAHAAGLQTIMVPDLVEPSDEIAELCAAVMESLHHVRHAAFGVTLAAAAPDR